MDHYVKIAKSHYQCSNGIPLLRQSLKRFVPEDKPLAIACVGTDKCTGDSLGPYVGHFLQHLDDVDVIGTLENPLHAGNVQETMKRYRNDNPNAFIIGVDASLSLPEEIGQIIVKNTPLLPGRGLGRKLGEVGDMSITGIVNEASSMNFLRLSCTRLHLVNGLAETIAALLEETIANTNKRSAKQKSG